MKHSTKQAIISKATLAAELGCPRGTISRLCSSGMPSREDGTLDRGAALAWIMKYRSGFNGGWIGKRRGKEDLNTRAKRLLEGESATAGLPEAQSEPGPCEHALLHSVRAGAFRYLPEIVIWFMERLKGCGEDAPGVALMVAGEVFDAVLSEFGDDLAPDYGWELCALPDYLKLARRAGLSLAAEDCDAHIERILGNGELFDFIASLKTRDATAKPTRKAAKARKAKQ